MLKSEYAIEQVRRRLTLDRSMQIGELTSRARLYTDDGDPRWIGVALMRLHEAGEIRYLTCDDNHNHDSACAVELVPA